MSSGREQWEREGGMSRFVLEFLPVGREMMGGGLISHIHIYNNITKWQKKQSGE